MTSQADPVEPDAATAEAERRVSWAELFFDLVFVVGVTRTSTLVTGDHSPAGLLRALIVFVPAYWLWVGTAIQTNLVGTERPVLRLRLFAIGLAAVFLAVSMPAAWGDRAVLFAAAYWIGRLILGLPTLRMSHTLTTPYAMSMLVTGPLLLVGAFLHGAVRESLWGLAAVLDLATPTIFHRTLSRVHYAADHLVERFGLFLLIALGESMVAVASAAPDGITVAAGFAVAAAFTVVAGLWWVYFQYAHDAMRFAVATARVPISMVRVVLSYGHLILIGSVIVIAVGLHLSLQRAAHPGAYGGTALLYGGTTAYLATYVMTRWAMFRKVSWTRLTAALVTLCLLPAALHVPALVTVLLIAAVLIVLNGVEWCRVEHRRS